MEEKSFLRARDPSILSRNRPLLNPELRKNLFHELDSETQSEIDENTMIYDDSGQLDVYLRIKPSGNLNEHYQIGENSLTCRIPPTLNNSRKVHGNRTIVKKYSFTKVYGPDASQTEIFNDCIKRRVLGFINGRNSTIFAYGISGSGKTYTMLGTPDEPGIIPRALEYLFRSVPSISATPKVKPADFGSVILLDQQSLSIETKLKNKLLNLSSNSIDRSLHVQTYKTMQTRLSAEPNAILSENGDVDDVSVWVSFAEIYNEQVYDLLLPETNRIKQRPKLRLGQSSSGCAYVRDLTNVYVGSGLEAFQILQFGMHNLNYASTCINTHSSRSHCIFSIKLVQVSTSGTNTSAQLSQFNFCDLAGSERVKNTKNVGDRLKETNNINTSLHILGRCVKLLRDAQQKNDTKLLIPYRESKLTRLFQHALSGQESIAMVVNVNGSAHTVDESQHVLNFSAIAKDIAVEKETKPETYSIGRRFSQFLAETSDRSTRLPSSCELDYQVDTLREQVLTLMEYLEMQRLSFEEKEEQIRREVIDSMSARYREMMDNQRSRYENEKQAVIKLYENKLENQQKLYEIEFREIKRKRLDNSVISVNDEEDEEAEEADNDKGTNAKQTEEMKKAIENLETIIDQLNLQMNIITENFTATKQRNQELNVELKEKKSKITTLEIKLLQLDNDKDTIQKQLEEAVLQNIQLSEELNSVITANKHLTKKLEQIDDTSNQIDETSDESNKEVFEEESNNNGIRL